MKARLVPALRAAADRRKTLAASGDTTAFRVVNGESPELKGITVDWFGGIAVLSLYDAPPPEEEAHLVRAVSEVLSPRSIYLKRRPREARLLANAVKDALAPEEPVHGQRMDEHIVLENRLQYIIRPGQGLSVGLYLDMRDARAWLLRHVDNASVLNCFAYTCAFSVSARAGGAKRVVSLDLSRRVLQWGQQNAALNGQETEARDDIVGDVFEWLPRMTRRKEAFNVVVLDPPSFATSKRKVFSAGSHYGHLVDLASPLVVPGGLLLACCNLSSLSWEKFEAMVGTSLKASGRGHHLVERIPPSEVDFPAAPGGVPGLKVLVFRL